MTQTVEFTCHTDSGKRVSVRAEFSRVRGEHGSCAIVDGWELDKIGFKKLDEGQSGPLTEAEMDELTDEAHERLPADYYL